MRFPPVPGATPAARSIDEPIAPGHAPRAGILLTAILAGLLALAATPARARAQDEPEPQPANANANDGADEFAKRAAPFLQTYCASCHTGDNARGGLQIEVFASEEDLTASRPDWENILVRVEDGDMPPKNKPQPTDEERKAFLEYVETVLSTRDCAGPVDPGRVTMRRLNRVQYNNTVRDLLGVDFRPGDQFPSDDVGYGFDNIGDVLTLPTLLLEKYLDAAAEIVDRAIVTPESLKARPFEILNQTRTLPSVGEVDAVFDVPFDGEYRVEVSAWGQQAGGELVRMELRVEGKPVQEFRVKAANGRAADHKHTVKLERGRRRIAAAFLNDYYNPDDPDPKNRDRNLIVEGIRVVGPFKAKLPPPSEAQKRLFAPGEGKPEGPATRAILGTFAARAYRRPVQDDELDRLVALARRVRADGNSFQRSIQIAVQAVLVSPHFLFLVERDRPAEPAPPAAAAAAAPAPAAGASPSDPVAVPLNDWELASRLSYFLWSSMPDDELFRAAARGRLRDPEELERQVRRMIRDPKVESFVQNFAGQWLQIGRLDTVSPARRQFPFFNPALKDAMRLETERFFAHILQEDRSLLEFLDSDYTFVNERLARLYNIDGVRGDEFRKVELKDDRRGGIITHASVLTVTSNPSRTSPVKRGKYILEQILGTPPPPPPPDVPELKEERGKLVGTLRQRMEQHRSNPDCATCHAKMDPLGFGLENFNAIGAWRDTDNDQPIDASGELPDGRAFSGPAELRKILLASRDKFRKCLTEKLMIYALGRGLDFNDRCVVDAVVAKVEAEGDVFSNLIVEIVKSDPFRMRSGSPPQTENREAADAES